MMKWSPLLRKNWSKHLRMDLFLITFYVGNTKACIAFIEDAKVRLFLPQHNIHQYIVA
ncbi:hypothetical protein HanPI659440_Chr10g0382001 [Helianthus annuus]|nr:hypothetical protein HanPI659440_Chr10g0382001 [Helianthus annuus]